MVALAIPALSMHTINPGVAGLPRSLPIMQTYDRIQDGVPRRAAPGAGRGPGRRRHRARGPAGHRGDDRQGAADTARSPASRSRTQTSPGKTLEVVNIPMQGDGTDAKSETALATLRDGVIPQTIGSVTGARST